MWHAQSSLFRQQAAVAQLGSPAVHAAPHRHDLGPHASCCRGRGPAPTGFGWCRSARLAHSTIMIGGSSKAAGALQAHRPDLCITPTCKLDRLRPLAACLRRTGEWRFLPSSWLANVAPLLRHGCAHCVLVGQVQVNTDSRRCWQSFRQFAQRQGWRAPVDRNAITSATQLHCCACGYQWAAMLAFRSRLVPKTGGRGH